MRDTKEFECGGQSALMTKAVAKFQGLFRQPQHGVSVRQSVVRPSFEVQGPDLLRVSVRRFSSHGFCALSAFYGGAILPETLMQEREAIPGAGLGQGRTGPIGLDTQVLIDLQSFREACLGHECFTQPFAPFESPAQLESSWWRIALLRCKV